MIKFSILLDMKGYLIVVLLCIPLAVSEVQHYTYLSNVLSSSVE